MLRRTVLGLSDDAVEITVISQHLRQSGHIFPDRVKAQSPIVVRVQSCQHTLSGGLTYGDADMSIVKAHPLPGKAV